MRLAWLFPVALLGLASCIAATERPGAIMQTAGAVPPTVDAPAPALATPGTEPAALAAADPLTTLRSSLLLLMPVDGMRVSDVINNFGAPRGGRWHEGIDLFAERGTPVRPAAPGVVWLAGETGLGGLSVSILGDDGLRYFYTHLDSIPAGLAAGQRVHLLDVIGYVGNSGNASGGPTHLHFAVYAPTSDGSAWMAFDPTPHLIDRSSGG